MPFFARSYSHIQQNDVTVVNTHVKTRGDFVPICKKLSWPHITLVFVLQGLFGLVLISGLLCSQSTSDITHKPSSRLPLLSARHMVSFPASDHHRPWPAQTYTAWCAEERASERLVWGHQVTAEWTPLAGDRTDNLFITSLTPCHHATYTL